MINPDKEIADDIRRRIDENDGYCPCRIDKTPDTICPCKEFRETQECICGLYVKSAEEEPEEKEITLEEQNVILKIPKNAVRITIGVQIIQPNGAVINVHKMLMPDDIRQARTDFLENVEDGDDYDTHYVLTEKGREYLDQLQREGK
jgi:hypothetical protein